MPLEMGCLLHIATKKSNIKHIVVIKCDRTLILYNLVLPLELRRIEKLAPLSFIK